ncbi:AT4g05510 [Arabidopsis thaliana]|uniref:AT4g05510 protein n=1 Tax=Arabidopsis thaliana TaxID=3702 RepID=Q9S9W0_ARATH|nr:contains similarity to transposases [Arabidopsis thaliana]CAB81093.1 AT4g05510 [Arabidopsis thaliana]
MDNEDECTYGGEGGQTSADTSQSKSLVSASRFKRSRTSDMWDYFTLEDENDGKIAYCKKCLKPYPILPTTGTSNLIRHHRKCSMGLDVGRKTTKIDHKVVREKFSRVIIRHDLPFLCVEYEELRDFISYMNPDYKCYTRNTAAADVVKTWEKEKQILKSELERIPSRICLTSDCWTSLGGDGYIVLTAHYVDTRWILNSKILSFSDMLPPHTGDALASKIHECLKEWGIEKKVFTLTLDNATANNSMQEVLIDRLKLDNNLMCKGEFFHVRCCAHVLNRIVQNGLDVISDALSKIRETVKYVKGSTSRRLALAECVEGKGEVLLSLDVQTRWNSTYLMLHKALKYQRALNRFKIVDKNYKNCPSSEEWKRAKTIHEILMPFYKITNLMSGRSYSTSNLYFGHVWKIQCLLEMRLKFDKYWKEYSVILAMRAVLDPRMKFKLLKRCYDELDPTTSQEKIDFLETKITELFGEYRKAFPVTPVDLFDLDDVPEVEEGKSALDMYLEDPKLEMKNHPNLNVLQYWKENRLRFGALAYMAMDVLSIPITSVASESSFSIGSHVLNKYRSRLLPTNVQALLCTRSWLYGFVSDEEGMIQFYFSYSSTVM